MDDKQYSIKGLDEIVSYDIPKRYHKKSTSSKVRNFFYRIGVTALYWAVMLFGPVLIGILNNIGYYVSGGGYRPGSLMYAVLQFAAQPASCWIAYSVTSNINNGSHRVCVMVNCMIGVCMNLFLAVYDIGSARMVSMLLSAAVCMITVIMSAKSIDWN